MSHSARKTLSLSADGAGVSTAAAILAAGGLVAFPTETVYGLGADARSDAAVARIFAAKDRPRFNPLIAHVADVTAALRLGRFGPAAERLAARFWPGPLTLVVPVEPDGGVGLLARAGLASVALRVPNHPVARALLEATGFSVAAPSANRSGRISPTEATHVLAELDGRIDAVIMGDATTIGLESTIVSCLGEPRLLRPGGITREALATALGRPVERGEARGAGEASSAAALLAPGMMQSHYAPRAALRLGTRHVAHDEAALDFGGILAGCGAAAYLDLSPRGDLAEAASHLFGFLRRLDAALAAQPGEEGRGGGVIAVAPIPAEGLGEAILDRLERAAAPRL